jgi:hypothetical protein
MAEHAAAVEDRLDMKLAKLARPRTAADFARRLRPRVDAEQHRLALAHAERFSREFLPQLSADELNRVSAMMEGVATIVELENWQSAHAGTYG